MYCKLCRKYVYNSPDTVSATNASMLNGYCVNAVYNNNSIISDSIFTPEDCNRSLCASEAVVPTEPDIGDHSHWFFNYALYFGGTLHFLLSVAMALSYFIIHIPEVKIPRLKKLPYNFYLYVVKLQ